MASQGIGTVNIAKAIAPPVEYDANGRKRKGYGSLAWFIKLLSDRAVLGEFKPAGGSVVPNMFPQIIDQSLFDEVREVVSSKRKNGKLTGGHNNNSAQADNLFTGLMYDLDLLSDTPARPIHFQRVQRGAYLTSAFSPTEKQNRIRYSVVEYAALGFLADEDWQAVAVETESPECTQARAELETVLREVDVMERKVARINAAMDDPAANFAVLSRKLGEAETALATLQARKDALQANVERACRKCDGLYSPERMLDLISQNTPEATEVRLKLRALIRQAVARIDIVFDLPGASSPDKCALIMTYVNGVSHAAVFSRTGKGLIVIGDLGKVVGAAQ